MDNQNELNQSEQRVLGFVKAYSEIYLNGELDFRQADQKKAGWGMMRKCHEVCG